MYTAKSPSNKLLLVYHQHENEKSIIPKICVKEKCKEYNLMQAAIKSQFYRKIVINQTVEIRLCYTRQESVSRFRP